ncbi:glycosyl transferase family 2 protein [Coleophoma cylindrospora]|uniref:dolichyl-phosphate beta-glucosyltransferase n=1 Tax=Coleophoma cylindrospora TaxID=1849047 RepID=A0A3D8RUJ1_9HELO|nr:glycosyl transferase family 2 protein [Coleophoma cylindrospora]
MPSLLEIPIELMRMFYSAAQEIPWPFLLLGLASLAFSFCVFVYASLYLLAPLPRPALPAEKTYITTAPDGSTTAAQKLPCWHDAWLAQRKKTEAAGDFSEDTGAIDAAEVEMSVVIPAYNEEERLEEMLQEAVEYLDAEYGRSPISAKTNGQSNGNGNGNLTQRNAARPRAPGIGGYEILLVNDGSRDRTVEVALAFSRKHALHDIMRIVSLKENRGKGGAVTHGFRHTRGAYTVFADADGASKFGDLTKLVEGCKEVADEGGRSVAVGSRAHLVGSEAVVKRSALRNALMHSFHLLLRLLTPPKTSQIRDTQCGFKLFSRAALPHIIPYMHAEGWIFDVEMLMLAESAPAVSSSESSNSGVPVSEVPIGWKEVGGSKLNVMWDSLGMAWGLALLRASWMIGVYKRR